MSQDPFFGGGRYFAGNSVMDFGGLTCTLHMPRARESQFVDGVEKKQSLPECNPRAAFLVDNLQGAKDTWMPSEPGILSYMVPVKAEHGLWLDFRGNCHKSHDVAIVVSTQGVNALTTLQTHEPKLVQYRAGNLCPIHRVPFVGDRYCNECKYEWSPQNYLATTGTPSHLFWLDGFRTVEGVTRQWVFTEDVERGVAAAVLGGERVHALGIAFFRSKNPKPVPAPKPFGGYRYRGEPEAMSYMPSLRYGAATKSASSFGDDGILERPLLEIAGGAMIDQLVYPDPQALDYWEEEPVGIIVINYTDEQTALEVLAHGSSSKSEGPLADLGVPLGHKKTHSS